MKGSYIYIVVIVVEVMRFTCTGLFRHSQLSDENVLQDKRMQATYLSKQIKHDIKDSDNYLGMMY